MLPKVELALIGFIVFGFIPVVLAMTIERWFWHLPLFGKLIQRKLEWDAETILHPGGDITIKTFRETAGMGAKVTVAHHLATAANDIKIQLGRAQFRAFLVTLVGFGLVAFAESNYTIAKNDTTSPAAQIQNAPASPIGQTPSSSPTPATGNARTLEATPLDVLLRILITYTLPVGAAVLLIESYTLIFALFDQARKYEDLLDPERVRRRGAA